MRIRVFEKDPVAFLSITSALQGGVWPCLCRLLPSNVWEVAHPMLKAVWCKVTARLPCSALSQPSGCTCVQFVPLAHLKGDWCSWPTCPPSLKPAQGRSYTVMVSCGQGDLKWASPQPGCEHPCHHSITRGEHLKNIFHLQFWETNLTHLNIFLLPSFFFVLATEDASTFSV